MEESPQNSIEDDPEEDDDDVVAKKSFFSNLKGKTEKVEKTAADEKSKTTKEDIIDHILGIDSNPELDASAPVEHLSEVEVNAINKSLATERLSELEEEANLDEDTLAAEYFLENLALSGDLDQAYKITNLELGYLNLPKITEHLVSDDYVTHENVGSGDNVGSTAHLESTQASTSYKAIKPAIKREKVSKISLFKDIETSSVIVDKLIYRREARITPISSDSVLRKNLAQEVFELKEHLDQKETEIRQLAMQRERTTENTMQSEIFQETPKSLKNIVENSNSIDERILDKVQKIEDKKETKKNFQLKRKEMMLVASKIEISHTTLRKIFEANQISEKGLRRILEVYFRGGNIKKALKRELVEREIDFERDPNLRDQGSLKEVLTTTSKGTLDTLLNKTGISFDEIQPSFNKVSRNSASDKHHITRKLKHHQLRFLDLFFIIFILILLSIIIVLVLKGK